ncbi:gamma-glutamyltransferase [Antarctobacter heliothermus]|uniref:Glutathione hydrolase proenzyme n=1 Tax=Antarctobacter heliothermus TaxID=74033 RepID=A0A239IA83_9RHOB|nr:gamma-glutamyltransferase [Antarctobacter heliothermus]SNS90429.1 gamma-glutamyltranspeptidase / glutathione hydrolase [Antarctobacter heliothermus]
MRFIMSFAVAGLLGSASLAQQAADAVDPEQAVADGGFAAMSAPVAEALAAKDAGRPVMAENWMVAAANPHAVQAGAEVLRAGGTAADAMIAVQSVLGLVEPQSSGMGGGAFLVWHDGATGEITTLDGRETAPLAATPRLFQDAEGNPLKFWDAVVGGRSVGVPGTPALMQAAHEKWGKSDWAGLFGPATRLAEGGFAVSPRLAGLVAGDADRLGQHGPTKDYFYPGGAPIAEGSMLTNPAYAAVMRAMAADGAAAIYEGPIAQDIVDTVQGFTANPGVMTLRDLATYEVKERPAVCAPFRGHEVCGMGPPSSGALTVGQILGLLDASAPGDPGDVDTWRKIGDASRLAFADRGRYMADSDFVPMPTKGLVDPAYLAERAKLLAGDDALPEVAPGMPAWDHAMLWADDESIELPSTSHISIVDQYGNALSMTTTIENGFGSRLMTNGFLLNNELTDFSFRSHADGVPIANAVAPGKRPRSSMAPTIVRKDGAPVLVIGSPGGSRIIGYVAQAIIAHVDWGMDVQQAVATPHGLNRFGTFDLEEGTDMVALQAPLEALGFEVSVRDLTSGLHAIAVGSDGLQGGADPRREGIALGE